MEGKKYTILVNFCYNIPIFQKGLEIVVPNNYINIR